MITDPAIRDAIVYALTPGPAHLDKLRRIHSRLSYASLRCHLARLEECGVVQRDGLTYRLLQTERRLKAASAR
jgi:DNA-binding HxlR family transcriptional regulator